MANVLKISEASSLAFHSMAYLAVSGNGHLQSTRDIAGVFNISEAHLSKVFQRLARVGLVSTQRGPKGGIALARPAEDITLLHIYEAIEGPLAPEGCLLGSQACDFTSCIMGDLLLSVNTQVRDYFEKTTLARLARKLGGGIFYEDHAENH
jgi:Rrf2 family protein